jgi:hypothetical protein
MRGGWWVEDDGWQRRIRGLLILLELAVRTVEDAKIPFIELDKLTGPPALSHSTCFQRRLNDDHEN